MANYPKFRIHVPSIDERLEENSSSQSLKQFLKAAFERHNQLGKVKQKVYGAKILLTGSDRTVYNFLQEYVPAC